jgi:hypothetical protein
MESSVLTGVSKPSQYYFKPRLGITMSGFKCFIPFRIEAFGNIPYHSSDSPREIAEQRFVLAVILITLVKIILLHYRAHELGSLINANATKTLA